MEQAPKHFAPYVPFSTFLSGVEALQQGLPERLDKSVWLSFSGSAKSHTMSAFRFLGLVDDAGTVQESLRRLVNDRENRKTALRDVLEAAYPDVIALAKSNGTASQLRTTMQKYAGTASTTAKAITFFLKAAEFAGLPVSGQWKGLSRSGGGGGNGRPKKRRATETRESKPEGTPTSTPKPKAPVQEQTAGESVQVTLRSGRTVTLLVSGSILSMPADDRTFLFSVIDRLQEYGEHGQQPDGSVSASIGQPS